MDDPRRIFTALRSALAASAILWALLILFCLIFFNVHV